MPRQQKRNVEKVRQKALRTPEHVRVCMYLMAARRKAGMTQVELASRLGWRQGDVSKVETGERRIDIVEIVRFANEVGFDPCDLVREVAKEIERTRSGRRRSRAKRELL